MGVNGRPAYLTPSWLALIWAGGTLGTLARAGLARAVPVTVGHWPWATFTVNLIGALILGGLLETLQRIGPDDAWRRHLRLAAGTGFCGGFTTYSAFAVEVVQNLHAGHPLLGLGYAVGSVVLGVLVAAGGFSVARSFTRDHRA